LRLVWMFIGFQTENQQPLFDVQCPPISFRYLLFALLARNHVNKKIRTLAHKGEQWRTAFGTI
jgi:hypothetical protein